MKIKLVKREHKIDDYINGNFDKLTIKYDLDFCNNLEYAERRIAVAINDINEYLKKQKIYISTFWYNKLIRDKNKDAYGINQIIMMDSKLLYFYDDDNNDEKYLLITSEEADILRDKGVGDIRNIFDLNVRYDYEKVTLLKFITMCYNYNNINFHELFSVYNEIKEKVNIGKDEDEDEDEDTKTITLIDIIKHLKHLYKLESINGEKLLENKEEGYKIDKLFVNDKDYFDYKKLHEMLFDGEFEINDKDMRKKYQYIEKIIRTEGNMPYIINNKKQLEYYVDMYLLLMKQTGQYRYIINDDYEMELTEKYFGESKKVDKIKKSFKEKKEEEKKEELRNMIAITY